MEALASAPRRLPVCQPETTVAIAKVNPPPLHVMVHGPSHWHLCHGMMFKLWGFHSDTLLPQPALALRYYLSFSDTHPFPQTCPCLPAPPPRPAPSPRLAPPPRPAPRPSTIPPYPPCRPSLTLLSHPHRPRVFVDSTKELRLATDWTVWPWLYRARPPWQRLSGGSCGPLN